MQELEAMRGLDAVDLRRWLRTNKYPQFLPKKQGPLTDILKSIDQLPGAIKAFFSERENPDDSVTVEPAGYGDDR